MDDKKNVIEYRKMKPKDFFKIKFEEKDDTSFTGDSVFVNRDKCLQGRINHQYQRFSLLLKLLFGRSPINYVVITATHRDIPVGVIWARIKEGNKSIVGIFIKNDYRRMGIGTGLMEEMCKYADKNNIELSVTYNSKNFALKMAEKRGFKLEHEYTKLVRTPNKIN